MPRLTRNTLLCAFVCFFLLSSLLAQTLPSDLDTYIPRVMKEFEVPGIAVAVVKDGRIAFAKGYGIRKLGESTPVDENTLFAIGSNTKAFTGAAVAILADDGKLSWSDPVIQHLPAFQMYDPWVTREIMVSELFPHHSGLGLGEGDLLFFPPSNLTREDIVRRVRYLKPATTFRSSYAYDNILYAVLGELIRKTSGKTWEDFVKERIFTPLNMNTTNTSVKDITPQSNAAAPHSRVNGKLQAVRYDNIDAVAPAGSINSSVAEMSRWLITQLNRGQISGSDKRLFSEKQSRFMWTVQTILPVNEGSGATKVLQPHFAGYGSGWGLRDYAGRKMVSHDGGVTGQVSRVVLIPEENLGLVILTNQEEGGALASISWHILDSYLKGTATDWVPAFLEQRSKTLANAAEVEKKQDAGRAANAKPSLELAKYAGDYRDDWFGAAKLSIENGKLVLTVPHSPSLTADLDPWQYDTFRAKFRDPVVPDAFVTFALTPEGTVDSFKMRAVSPLADFSYDYQDLLFHPVATH